MGYASMVSASASEAIGDRTVATSCAATRVSLVPNAISGGAPTIATPRDSVWLANAVAQRDLLAGIAAFPSCVGIDVMKCADLTVTLRLASSVKVSAQISIGAKME